MRRVLVGAMTQLASCPYCRSQVVPVRDAQGRNYCPACNNTGRIQPPAQWGTGAFPDPGQVWSNPSPQAVHAHMVDQKAGQARTWGILGLVLPLATIIVSYAAVLFGLASAIVAVMMGSKYKRMAQAIGHAPAMGKAQTAFILGIVGIGWCVLVTVLAVTFLFFLFGMRGWM